MNFKWCGNHVLFSFNNTIHLDGADSRRKALPSHPQEKTIIVI